MEHTELPWRRAPLCGGGRFELLGKKDIYIGEIHSTSSACLSRVVTSKEAEANADFIVLACNAHKDLLAACEAIVDAKMDCSRIHGDFDKTCDYCLAYEQAKAAIAAAQP